MKNSIWNVLLIGGIVTLGGCAATPDAADEVADGVVVEDIGEREGAEAAGARMGGEFQGSPLDDPDSPLSQRVFYFEFDSSELSEQDRQVLMAHGRYLAENPQAAVVVEGHTDERGSREYNLALGERRAQSVEQVLLLQAPSKDQLQVISFGEERPVAMGHDEAAWRLNRRVELLYSGQ